MGPLEALIVWFVPLPGKLGCEGIVFQLFRELFAPKEHVIVGYDRRDVLIVHIVGNNYKVGAFEGVVLCVAFGPKEFMPQALRFRRIERFLVLITDWAGTGLQIHIFVRQFYIIKVFGGFLYVSLLLVFFFCGGRRDEYR